MENNDPMLLKLPSCSLPKQAPNPEQEEEDIDDELEEGEFRAAELNQDEDNASNVVEEEIVETYPKKRVCDICFKEFKDGKALGGHLRIHNLKGKKANAPPGLDVGGPFKCPEPGCHKSFKSEKCVHGHMRSHPDRPYRGMPRPEEQPLGLPRWRGLTQKKRGCPLVGVDNEGSTFVTQDELLAAAVLMMLGGADFTGDNKKTIPRQERLKMIERGEFDEDEKYFIQDYLGLSIAPSPSHLDNEINTTHKKRKVITGVSVSADGKWPCFTCGKAFLTYQALGGHMSSHNKDKTTNHKRENVSLNYESQSVENNTKKIYTCPVCHQKLQSVDTLADHLTRYHSASPSSSTSSPPTTTSTPVETSFPPTVTSTPPPPSTQTSSPPPRRGLMLDLNEFPMEE